MPPKPRTTAAGRLIGYARVSTEDQGTDPQSDELRTAGCATMREEHASGADRTRPVLARLLRDIAAGDTLVVVRLDRLARSVSHLLAVIEQLEAKGAHFRSLRDPIDTSTPQGMFSLQVLGAVAQLERALIAERTKAGLLAARKRGRVGGNPGLRAGDPAAIRKVQASRDAAHLEGVLAQLDSWLPTVRRMRPGQPWGDVVRVLNQSQAASWTVERLRRTVRRLAAEGIIEASLLDRARPQTGDDRLIRLLAGIKAAAPDRTLQQIAAQLEAMRERTPRGGTRWHPSSVKHLLARAERLGSARMSDDPGTKFALMDGKRVLTRMNGRSDTPIQGPSQPADVPDSEAPIRPK
jgi:DNA invertase Pin-like site-specific DNA recombinase